MTNLDCSISSHRLTRKLVAIALPTGLDATLLNTVLTSLRRIPDDSSNIISSNLVNISVVKFYLKVYLGIDILLESGFIFAGSGGDEEGCVKFSFVLIKCKVPFSLSAVLDTCPQDNGLLVWRQDSKTQKLN